MTNEEIIGGYRKIINDQEKIIRSCFELIAGYEERLNVKPPLLLQGLLDTELMIENLKKSTGEPLEFDSLKITDEERRKRLGARIRLLRNSLGLKQAELAEKLNITPAAVATYEAGKREPTFRNLIGLSRALNTTTDWLLGEPPPPTPTP